MPQGLSERNTLAGAGKRFLVNKYYLDYLYEKIIVAGIKGPIAAGVYWFNQNVIDNVLNYTGKGAQAAGRFTYNYIDQKGVDGLVNGIATLTGESGARGAQDPDRSSAVLRTHARRRRRGVRRRPLDLHLGKGNRLDAFLVRLLGVDPRGLHPGHRRGHHDAHPREEEEAIKWTALLTTLATLGFTIATVAKFDYDKTSTLQFSVTKNWIDVINSHYHVAVDGISLPMLALSSFITVLCVIYSWNHFPEPHNPKAFLALLLILEVGMNGTFVAQDLILFFIFFEIVLLPMFFMIGVWGGPNREYASIKFFLFTLFGSALMLLSFLALYFKVDVPGVGHTFDMVLLSHAAGAGLVQSTGLLIFGGLFIGFAIKVPMFPFHTWLPDAHTEAPTVGSVLLAAILLKLGTYGFIRIALPILPEAAKSWAPWIGLLSVIGIIYGALGLSRGKGHEATDRVLVGRAHGFRDARHRDAHDVRHQRRDLRHGRARSHHRHAVLHRRFGAAQLRHPRDLAARRVC